jgi:excisionase family DNA binding protein
MIETDRTVSDKTGQESSRDLLTVAQAAHELGVPERTVRRWIAEGKLPSKPHPLSARGRLIPEDALHEFSQVRALFGPQRHQSDAAADLAAADREARVAAIPSDLPEVEIQTDPDADRSLPQPVEPDGASLASPNVDMFRELLIRHESAHMRLGYLQAKADHFRTLVESHQDRAEYAEEKALEEAEARRRIEREADEVRRDLEAAKAALRVEMSKGWFQRVFG